MANIENIGGVTFSKRRLLMSSTQCILYDTEVWADALGKEVYHKRVAQVQRRGALRVASACRIASAGLIPVAFLVKEPKVIYKRKGEESREVVAREERQHTLGDWQLYWQNETRDRWTARSLAT